MCTRHLWAAEGQPVLVGRNMDWTAKMGSELIVLPRGIDRTGETDVNPAAWRSKYGSVVTRVWDCATVDGINEAGLGVNLLYLAETRYGERDPAREGLSLSIWAQYFLDNFSTVSEAIQAARNVQVVPLKLVHKGDLVDGPVHMSLADASGDSAIVEVLDGEVVIHHGPEFQTMTNSPPYDEQLVLMRQYEGLGGSKPLPGTSEAEDRFVRAAYYGSLLPEEPENYQAAVAGVLSVMRNASTPFGVNDPERPNISATLWRTISDLTNLRYYFEFSDMPNLVWVDLDDFDLSQGGPVLEFDLAQNFEASGKVSDRFTPRGPIEFQAGGTTVIWPPPTEHRPAESVPSHAPGSHP